MDSMMTGARSSRASIEHFDVLIVGGGLSGVGAACHLQAKCPGMTYAILESRDCIGGTWDLFRFPGIRSDSDMFTLGYSFQAWKGTNAIAGGSSILNYIRQTAKDYAIDRQIRFKHRVMRASWLSEEAKWTVEVERGESKDTVRFSCNFLFVCAGYYSYAEGYTPEFAGVDRFKGRIVHPQKWTDDVDYAGKRVVVIGSGATAVTMVPAVAEQAAHVTMLQRSPTYIISLAAKDTIATFLRRILPVKFVYSIARWKNVFLTMLLFLLSRYRPELMKKILRARVRKELGSDFDVDTHFKPSYNPWDQRLCVVPDSDLFKAMRAGRASVVTDHIETFTEQGIKLKSGAELVADLIVTATGLRLEALGGIQLTIDGQTVDIRESLSYKGMMLSDVPNLASAVGYTNASWTLKSDLICGYVCRMLKYMDKHGYRQCTPRHDGPVVATQPFFALSSGFIRRSTDQLPKQGSKAPWRIHQNYLIDIVTLRLGALDDGVMEFSSEGAVFAADRNSVATNMRSGLAKNA